MTSIGETKTVVLVLLCLLFATATSCTESDELSPFESDGADMGANSAKAGVAWASLDKDGRDEFGNELSKSFQGCLDEKNVFLINF